MDDTRPHAATSIVLPEVSLNRYTPKSPTRGIVHKTELCTATHKTAAFVRHIEIDVGGTDLVGLLRPGQSFGVIPPGVDEDGRPHKVRLFSVASPTRGEDGGGRIIATTVKRVIDEHWQTHRLFRGVCSNHLCDLREGDEVMLTGPSGKRFLLPVDAGQYNYIFFATGTGIAPFRAMAIELLEAGVSSQIFLLMGAPYATNLLYHPFFLGLAKKHQNFHYLTAISRERQEDGHDRMYIHQRLETNREVLLPVLTSPNTLIYICGVTGMELGIFQQLANLLSGDDLEQYLHVAPAALHNIDAWTRQMIRQQIRPTERVFVEVYE